MQHHNIPPNPFTDPKNLAKRSIFDRAGERVRSLVDAAFDGAIEAVEEQKKNKKKLSPWLQEIWDRIEDKIQLGKIQEIDLMIGGKTKVQLEKDIEVLGYKTTDYSKEMMEVMAQSKEFKKSEKNISQELELVELSVADLGFPHGATKAEIYKRAIELGLQLCPAEVAPQLRIQYQDQPLKNFLVIGMESIKIDSSDFPQLFIVCQRDDGGYLAHGYGSSDHDWHSNYRFVFVKPN